MIFGVASDHSIEINHHTPGPVIITIPYRALIRPNGFYRKLILTYNGKASGHCPEAFRVYYVLPGIRADYRQDSKQYGGSFALSSPDCRESYFLNYPKRRKPLLIHLIAIDDKGRPLNLDLKRSFSYRLD